MPIPPYRLPARARARLAGLLQLRALGFSDTETIPEALRSLHALLGSDSSHFVWTDRDGWARDYCGEGGDDEHLLRACFGHHAMDPPTAREALGHFGQARRLDSGSPAIADLNTPIRVSAPGDSPGHNLCSLVVRDPADLPRGRLVLLRARERFKKQDLEILQAASRALGSFFSPSSDPPPETSEFPVERGLALLSRNGMPTFMDASARALLRLAGHQRQDFAAHATPVSPFLTPRLHELCRRVLAPQDGPPAPPPQFRIRNAWGHFLFEGRSLQNQQTGQPDHVSLSVIRYLPAGIVYWRALEVLDLPIRQRQVCLDFACGYSMSEIATRLELSRNTVIDHVNRLYERFGLRASRDALRNHLRQQVL